MILPRQLSSATMATHLAYKDVWYRSYVFNPLHEQTVFPSIGLTQHQSFPSSLFGKVVQTYSREATRHLKAKMFVCNIIQTGAKVPLKIFWCQSFLLGCSVSVELRQRQMKLYQPESHLDAMEIYLEHMERHPITLLKITYLENGSLISKTEYKLEVEDLYLCSFARDYFVGLTPDPTSGILQLSLLTERQGRQYRRELNNKENFKKNSEQELKHAFKDLFINLSVVKIKLLNLIKEPMKVLVDGVLYDQVEQIFIEPAISKFNLPMQLPIKCFLPEV